MKTYNQQQVVLGAAFLILIFVLAVSYKYISTNIQQNKEMAVIEKREETKKEKTIYPKKIPVSINHINEYDNTSSYLTDVQCELNADLEGMQEWIKACYLKDLLTAPCKDIFNENGEYLADVNNESYNDGYLAYRDIKHQNGDADLVAKISGSDYYDKAKICSCNLPIQTSNEISTFKKDREQMCIASSKWKNR